MSLGILQLSDIHLKGNEPDVETWAESIGHAIQTQCVTLSALLVVFSGDVAYSGQTHEYDAARRLIERLSIVLKRLDGPAILGPVLVPGNHDCDFTTEGDVRPELLSTLPKRLAELNPDGETVERLTAIQSAFYRFEQSYSEVDRLKANRLYYQHIFDSPEGKIVVHCFNTAWISRYKELKGHILFPEQVRPSNPDFKPALAVSIFHHPYAWLETGNGRKFQRRIESISDIVFTGHEHDGDSFSRDSSVGEHIEYVEGAPLQAADATSGFNLVIVDKDANKYEVRPFAAHASVYEPLPSREVPFVRNPRLLGQYFENSPTFRRELTQLGGTFSHPIKDEDLQITDLFVYPDLRARSLLDKKDKLISSENVVEFVTTHRCVHISGNVLAGKTTLARKLYLDLHDDHEYVPILLTGAEITGDMKNAISAATDRAFRKQYPAEHLTRFQQLDRAKKALIIDDWHRVKFGSAAKKAGLLETAKKHFGIIITVGTDGTWLQELAEIGAGEQISDFWHCDIKEFGSRLRGRLVTKWHTLGREFDLDEEETTHLISTSENLLDNIIGKGVVPSDPFFILYALQVSEPTIEISITHGSFGHIYDALITIRLAKTSGTKRSEVGVKYTYLSLIAHKLFTSQKKHLSPADVREVHEAFERGYGISKDREKMIRELEEARILGRSGEDIGFLHKYCYYFFVAKYLQKAAANEDEGAEVTNLLHDMADMVHDEEFMNILIFYIYLTEDRRLIERIISNARMIYAEHEPCDLAKDVAFIEKLWKPSTITLASGDISANRENYRSRKDAASDAAPEETALSRTKYDKTLTNSVKLEFAFKSLQVMGQVLRNFPGELRADLKLELTTQSYQLGLRTLKAFLLWVEAGAEEMRKSLEDALRIYRARPDDGLTEKAGQVIAFMAELAIYGMIKKISYSVGLEELRETYEAVRKKAGEHHIPTRLIDLSIRLDHFPKMPMQDIEELADMPASKIVPHTILRLLVADHLYLFPEPYQLRQKLASLLGFDDKKSKKLLLSDKKIKPTTVR